MHLYDTFCNQIIELKYNETVSTKINSKLNELLIALNNGCQTGEIDSIQYTDLMEKIVDAILYVRNIKDGRGDRFLAYSYIYTLQQHLPLKAIFILYMIVNNNIGSWRDVCGYVKYIDDMKNPFIKPILGLLNNQLEKDVALSKTLDSQAAFSTQISYAALWIPRDNLQEWEMLKALVEMWCYRHVEYKSIYDEDKSLDRCKTMYLKMVKKLRNALHNKPEPCNIMSVNNARKKVLKPKTALWRILKWADNDIEVEQMNEKWKTTFVPISNGCVSILDLHYFEKGSKSYYQAIAKACKYAFDDKILVLSKTPEWINIKGCTIKEIINKLNEIKFVCYNQVFSTALNMASNVIVSKAVESAELAQGAVLSAELAQGVVLPRETLVPPIINAKQSAIKVISTRHLFNRFDGIDYDNIAIKSYYK